MPRGLIVYFSQGGTTARVAEAIAKGLRHEGRQIDLHNLRDGPPPDVSAYDLLGIGAPVYWYRVPSNVSDYVKRLPELTGRPAFAFVVHGTYRFDASNQLRRALERRGAREVGYFHCRGADYFLGYLRQGYFFSPGHPTAAELAQAENFGRDVAARAAGQPYARPGYDRPAPLVYRLERLFAHRWLARQVHSRLFKTGSRCNACGLCRRLCPTGNITEGKAGRPVFGRDCLLCLTCEMKCPQEAIASPLGWPLLLPFIRYNVSRASQDPSIDYVLVTHRRGRTEPVNGITDMKS